MGIPCGMIWALRDSKSSPDALRSAAHAKPTDKQERILKGYRPTRIDKVYSLQDCQYTQHDRVFFIALPLVLSCLVVYWAVGPTYQRQGREKLNYLVSCFRDKGIEHVSYIENVKN
jgi:hypothetical protein